MTTHVDEILRRNSLSVTESRKKILILFMNIHGALAHGDIERKAGEKFDRVTVYRTLQTFVEKGSFTLSLPLTTLFVTHFAKIAQKVTIMMTTFILFASNAELHYVLM